MNNFDNIKFKSYQKNFIFIFSVSFLYFFPLFATGSGRLIDYTTTHFSLLILSENLFSPYTFFYDLIGPGTRLPLGSGLYNFFPTSFFIQNYFLFFTSTIVFGLYLQLNFCKKLFKIFNFKNYYLLAFLLSTNITVIYHLLNSDGIKIFFTFSCLPCLLYYTLKFLNVQTKLYFYKLIFFLSFVTLNSHEGYLITSCLGFLLLVIFNRNFFFLSKTFFYFGLIIFFLVNIENIYRIYSDLSNYPSSERSFIKPYDLKHYTSGIVFIFKFLEDFFKLNFTFLSPTKVWDNFYLPFGGLLFYFSFIECLRLLLKNNSKNIYYINIIFLILIFLSFFDLIKITFGTIAASYAFRDAINFFSIILFGSFLNNIKSFKIKNFIIFLVLTSAIMHISSSIYLKFKVDRNNFDVIRKNDDVKNSIFSKTLENLDLKNKNFSKTYLSEGIWQKIYNQDEGFLTYLKNRIVCGESLAHLSTKLGFNRYLIISKHIEDKCDGRNNINILEDSFESFLGAIFLDNDYEFTKNIILTIIEKYIDFTDIIIKNNNYKEQIIKYLQHNYKENPKFTDRDQDDNGFYYCDLYLHHCYSDFLFEVSLNIRLSLMF